MLGKESQNNLPQRADQLSPEQIKAIYPAPEGRVLVLLEPIEDGWALVDSPVEVSQPITEADALQKHIGHLGLKAA